MQPTCPPLIDILRQIPDPRHRRGIRHPLSALLAVACAAMLCGYRSYHAIAEWGRNYDSAYLNALGFTRQTAPCAATFFQVFRRLDRERFEALLGAWAEQALTGTAPGENEEEALALDGKTLRGSRKQGAAGAHLLSVFSHRLGLTVAQAGVDDKTNEIPVTSPVLADYLDWPGQQQVFVVERAVRSLRTGEVKHETVGGVTSLSPERANAARLLRLVRQHWHIENRSHWVREVTFDEDRSQVRVGSIPQVMAALRNTVIGLIRLSGESNVAAATRRMAARPKEAVALLGLSVDF